MHIAVIGTGYVGLVSGTCFAEFGINVTCVDNNRAKIDALNEGKVPIYEPGLEDMVQKNVREERLFFTTNIQEAVEKALVIFIAVGTPQGDGGAADLSYVEEVAREIGRYMNGYKVIVDKSTVPVGTGKRVANIIRENQTGHYSFDVVSNPEFLREGSAIEDFMRPNRVVIGTSSDQAQAIMKDLYKPLYLIEAPMLFTSVESAEMIKYASNAFLATKISFVNEIANLCEKVGADVHHVAKGMGLDGRISSKFLHAGPGFGGSCFPKDTAALARLGKNHEVEMQVVRAAIQANESQKEKMVGKITSVVGDLAGKTIGVLGLSFKPNTDDMRDAPSLVIIKGLQRQGASIRAYDPEAMEASKALLREIEYCGNPYEVADGADALVLVTEWNQFRMLDLEKLKELLKSPVLVDLRNVYEPETLRAAGFTYTCVGRG
ncbi:MAG: UDP-glucose/GDP-mannose dehydrogenase family protein [Deltaproteobacteria bacterium]|nr:UDP-glucose/GDP-mannose dehydrogenase family protein [Deltaproteobacteria bacterium]